MKHTLYFLRPIRRQSRGFSLIELMIVVAILGILSSLAVPAFTEYTQRTRATTAILSLQPWQTGIALCWQQHGNFSNCTQFGQHGLPPVPDILPEGILSLVSGTTPGAIRATLDASDSQGSALIVELTPMSHSTQINWQLSCSDFAIGARITRCIAPLPGA